MYDIICIISFIIFIYVLNRITNKKSKFKHSKKQRYLDRKGVIGENEICEILKKFTYDGELYRNVYIPIKNGRETEIDILLVNSYGIFVIESKNWSGSIIGCENDSKWIQFVGGNKKEVDNPCKQNDYHVKRLIEYFKINSEVYYSIIVFGYNAKVDFTINEELNSVIGIRELDECMKSLTSSEKILSKEHIEFINARLQTCINKDEEFKEKHIERVKELKRRSV